MAHEELQMILCTRRGSYESYKTFQSCFGVQLSKFNALGSILVLLGSIAALYTRACMNVDRSQRILILAGAALNNNSLTNASSMNKYIEAIKYETIAAVF